VKNDNGALLDDALRQLRLTGGRGYGLEAVPTVQPVIVLDGNVAPMPVYGGNMAVALAAIAASRCEIRVAAATVGDVVFRVMVRIFAAAASPGYECVLGPTWVNSVIINSPYSDSRLGLGATSDLTVATSPVAGGAASTGGASCGTILPGAAYAVDVGPFWLPSSGIALERRLLVRPITDAEALNVQIHWQRFSKPLIR